MGTLTIYDHRLIPTNEYKVRNQKTSKIDIYTRGEASQLILPRHIPQNTPFSIYPDEKERQKFAYRRITTLTKTLKRLYETDLMWTFACYCPRGEGLNIRTDTFFIDFLFPILRKKKGLDETTPTFPSGRGS